jgi:uncharacterized protein
MSIPTPSSSTSHAGRFIWRELLTPTPADTQTFYADLFGWTPKEIDMGMDQPYLMLHHATLDEDVAGAMAPQMDGVPPNWLDYLTVDDVDAALAKVGALGGQAMTPAMDIPNVGRFAVVKDPTGAAFALFTSTTPGATDSERTPPVGTFCWSQLMTTDLAAAVPFYEALTGWTAAEMPGGMVVFNQGDIPRASAMTLPAEAQMPSNWLSYVAVDDADASTARATELGATCHHEPQTIPGMGRFSVLSDPAGAVFAVWKDLGASA